MGANPPGIRPPHTAPGPTASHVCKGDRHPPVRTGPRASEEKAGRPAGPPDPSAAPPTPPPASPLALALRPSRHSPCSQGPLRHMLTHSHTLTHVHTHTHAHSHAASHTRSLTRSHTHAASHTHTQSHTRSHTLTCSHTFTHIHTPTPHGLENSWGQPCPPSLRLPPLRLKPTVSANPPPAPPHLQHLHPR